MEATAASSTAAGSINCRSIRSLPETIRLMSSKSSIICAWALAFRSITSMPCAMEEARRSLLKILAHPTIAFSGVRSSWLSVATNSSLRRVARSASARAARSLVSKASRYSSARRRSAISLSSSRRRSSKRRLITTAAPMKIKLKTIVPISTPSLVIRAMCSCSRRVSSNRRCEASSSAEERLKAVMIWVPAPSARCSSVARSPLTVACTVFCSSSSWELARRERAAVGAAVEGSLAHSRRNSLTARRICATAASY